MDDDELTNQRSHAVFEFTKRKRWADILISELVNVAVFVFSTSGTVLHCDAATQPVTGYTEDQLLSKNFTDFLHGDTLAFFKALEECINAQREMTFYLRIRASDPRDSSTRLIELKANPYYAPGTTECLCVFSILSPYPSPAISDLDDFLALRIENERFALQLEALRAGNYSDDTLGSDTEVEDEAHTRPPMEENIVDKSERAIAQASAVLDAVAAASASGGTNKLPNASANPPTNEGNADGQPLKKKRRVTESSQGRICTACGRNNSPEWRKGPQGPKTLCNACGLRWAKKAKGTTRDNGTEVE